MAVAALLIMNESKDKPAPLKYPRKTYQIFDDPDVRTKIIFCFCFLFYFVVFCVIDNKTNY